QRRHLQPHRPPLLRSRRHGAGESRQRHAGPLHRGRPQPFAQRRLRMVTRSTNDRSTRRTAMKSIMAAALALSAFATGIACAQGPQPSTAASGPARDRASILAMQGEHIVDFAFDETVLLQPGYERSPAMRSGGDEVVIVVEDTPTRVVLQHILVDAKSGHVA